MSTRKTTDKKTQQEKQKLEKEISKSIIEDKENTTLMVKVDSKELLNQDTSENQIDSYAPAYAFFQKEFLESTNVLNESVRQLHSQNISLLKQPESDVRKVDIYSIEQARHNINAIAKLIQTKVNFIKVMKE